MTALRRSPLFYVGDKFKLAPQILPHFPEDIDRFFEPFSGGASISMNVKAKKFVLNDFDPYVSKLHTWLQTINNHSDLIELIEKRLKSLGLKSSYFGDTVDPDLKLKFPKTYFAKQNKNSYHALRDSFNAAQDKDMLDFYILLIFGFNRMIRFNSLGIFNVPVGNVDFNKNVVGALDDYISWAKENEILVLNGDYRMTLELDAVSKRDFIYFDPPYLIAQTEYNKIWSESDEQEFLNYLDGLTERGIRWALSNVMTYRGATNELLQEWAHKYSVEKMNINYINYHDNGDKKPGEVLVKNYD